MTTQSDTQKELKKILEVKFIEVIDSTLGMGNFKPFLVIRKETEHQILDLFKRMAKECVYEVKENLIGFHDTQAQFLEGMDRCAKQTYKNIDRVFK